MGTVVQPKLLREQEAQLFVERIENCVTRQLVEIPYREVLRRFTESTRLPKADFDLTFFVEGLFVTYSPHDRIEGYLNGWDHRWYPEEDDEIKQATFCPLPLKTTDKFHFLRGHEANWLIGSVASLAIYQIVGLALGTFGRRPLGFEFRDNPYFPQSAPAAQFDLLFCAEVLLDFYSDEQRLRQILASGKA